MGVSGSTASRTPDRPSSAGTNWSLTTEPSLSSSVSTLISGASYGDLSVASPRETRPVLLLPVSALLLPPHGVPNSLYPPCSPGHLLLVLAG